MQNIETVFNKAEKEELDKGKERGEKIIQKESDSIVKTIKTLTDKEKNIRPVF